MKCSCCFHKGCCLQGPGSRWDDEEEVCFCGCGNVGEDCVDIVVADDDEDEDEEVEIEEQAGEAGEAASSQQEGARFFEMVVLSAAEEKSLFEWAASRNAAEDTFALPMSKAPAQRVA